MDENGSYFWNVYIVRLYVQYPQRIPSKKVKNKGTLLVADGYFSNIWIFLNFSVTSKKERHGTQAIPLFYYVIYFLDPNRYSVPFFRRSILARCSQITIVAITTQQSVLKRMVGMLAPRTIQ